MRFLRTPLWIFTLMEGKPHLVYLAFIANKLLFSEEKENISECVFSPPMWVCWSFLPNCVQDTTGGCTLSMLYENTLQLSHTFTSAGVHCLDISIRNDISKLHTSFSLDVRRNCEWPHTHTKYLGAKGLLSITKSEWKRGRRSYRRHWNSGKKRLSRRKRRG